MFLGVAVFAIIATIAVILALRAVRALFRSVTGNKEKQEQSQEKKKAPDKAEIKKQSESEELDESQKEAAERKEGIDVPEETRRRFAASLFNGISESFSSEDTSFKIDGKAFADKCVSESALSFLEYNNRELAGEDFHGFNLIIEEDSRMVLTYSGSAVASITKVELESTAIINGEPVTGTMPGYRINTFPPEMKPGMVVGDLERMLEASEMIKTLPGDPQHVSQVMLSFFTQPDNIGKLKGAIDRKIQEKESVKKNREVSSKRTQGKPRRVK